MIITTINLDTNETINSIWEDGYYTREIADKTAKEQGWTNYTYITTLMKTYSQQFAIQYDKLYDLYNICYGDDSNDLFDELHDVLLYQVEGFNITLINEEDGYEITERDVEEITKLVKQVDKLLQSSNNRT